MSPIRSLLIGVGLCVFQAPLLSQSPSEVLSRAIEQLGTMPINDDAITDATAARLNAMKPKDVSDALYLALKAPEQVTNQRPSLNRLVRKLRDFDIDSWLDRLEAETDPFMLNYGVRIADLSTKADSPRLKSLKLRLLSDKRIGQELHGEARAYASKGMRVCDIMMNSLWSKEPESDRPPGYPVDAGKSLQRRDELITAYAKKFNVPIDGDVAVPPEPKLNQVQTLENVRQRAPESKPPTPTPSEEPISSTPWSIIVVLIVAATGLLWLLVKKRK